MGFVGNLLLFPPVKEFGNSVKDLQSYNAVFRDHQDILLTFQCVLNAAAHLLTGTHKFNHGLSHLLHEELHWLDVPERIHYKLESHCITVCSTRLLSTCCTPVSNIPSPRHLRSATRHDVTSSALSVVGPSLLQVRQSGTHYLTVSMTRCSQATASGNR